MLEFRSHLGDPGETRMEKSAEEESEWLCLSLKSVLNEGKPTEGPGKEKTREKKQEKKKKKKKKREKKTKALEQRMRRELVMPKEEKLAKLKPFKPIEEMKLTKKALRVLPPRNIQAQKTQVTTRLNNCQRPSLAKQKPSRGRRVFSVLVFKNQVKREKWEGDHRKRCGLQKGA